MKRFHSTTRCRLANDGESALLDLQFSDASTESVEIQRWDLKKLLTPLLRACYGMGERKAVVRPLAQTEPAHCVLVQSDERQVVAEGDSVWLLFRAGSEDLAFALTRSSALALKDALTKAILAPGP